jgi:flagellar biosynthesis chaperone FliJ
MIEVTRSYTQLAAMLAQQNELQQNAIDKLGAVPAS